MFAELTNKVRQAYANHASLLRSIFAVSGMRVGSMLMAFVTSILLARSLSPEGYAELIGSSKMVALLSLAAEKFDHVIIDGPPVLGLADAPLLGSIAEATVLVVEAGSTRRDFARSAVKRLRGTRTRLIGGVLTKVRSRGHSTDYYYSGNYYHYGNPSEAGS